MSTTMWIMLGALVGELLLLLFVALVVSYLRNRGQRRRDLKAVKALIARIKQGRGEREQAIEQFLAQGMGLSDHALQKAKVATLRGELALLQRIAGVYRLRESAALARIDDDLYAAVEPYHALSGDGSAAQPEAQGDGESIDAGELDMLRKENQRLSDELSITMETMSRMLNEYSNMFAGGETDDAAPISAKAAAADIADEDDGPVEVMSPEEDGSADADGTDVEAVAAEPVEEITELASDDMVEIAGADDTETDAVEASDSVSLTDEDDEIAAILRDAESQEHAARGDAIDEGDTDTVDSVLEEGPVEIVGLDEAGDDDVVTADEIDDLFDSVDAESKEPADGDTPLQSQGGG